MSEQTETRNVPAAARSRRQRASAALVLGLRNTGKRLAARKWLVLLAVAGLTGFAAFGGLLWQAALAGAIIFAATAAMLPYTGRVSREDDDEAARAAQQARQAQVIDILQALPHPSILLAENGVVLAYNRKAHEHWDNLRRGSHLSSAMRQPAVLDAVASIKAGAKPLTVTYTERVPVERRIGATVAALPAARRTGPDGPAILVSLHDLSEQERLNQMRADFVANASHELRTPLASVLGFIETLQGPARKDPKAQERFLTIMATQARRMTRLIDDLLSLSKVEMNVHLQPTELVDLNETVTHVAETLDPVAKEAGITITAAMAPHKVRVLGERDELVQLFQNLIQNAIKYGRKGGHIQVSMRRNPGDGQRRSRVTVAVADDGPGIAPEHLPRLTERFYRVDVASSREKGGTGLGLAIVKHIVTRHRGELQIRSEPGKGSTFLVHFDEVDGTSGEWTREDAATAAEETA